MNITQAFQQGARKTKEHVKRALRPVDLLRALLLYTPGILVVLLLFMVFATIDQGRDTVRHALEEPWRRAAHSLTLVFVAYVLWYSSRLLGFARPDLTAGKRMVRVHMPRFLAFSCYTSAALALLLSGAVVLADHPYITAFVVFALSTGVYNLLSRAGAALAVRVHRPASVKRGFTLIVSASVLLVLFSAGIGEEPFANAVLVGLQQAVFAVFVAVRSSWMNQLDKAYEVRHGRKRRAAGWQGWRCWDVAFPRQRNDELTGKANVLDHDSELVWFIWFNVVSALFLAFYVALGFNITLSKAVGALAIAFGGAALLAGFANMFRIIKARSGWPIGLIVLFWMIGIGFAADRHIVPTIDLLPNTTDRAAVRQPVEDHLLAWLDRRVGPELSATKERIPVYLVMADGGASRSGYWVAGVLHRLDSLTKGAFADHLLSLSGASGGSVGIATYHELLRKSGKEAGAIGTMPASAVLGSDLLSPTLSGLLCTDMINLALPCFRDRASILDSAITNAGIHNGHLFADGMAQVAAASRDGRLPILVMNTVRMEDGAPAHVSNVRLDAPLFSGRLDVLDLLPAGKDLRLSTAMVLSSRFPYISPAGRIDHLDTLELPNKALAENDTVWEVTPAAETTPRFERTTMVSSYFVDGGYFDNSGAGVTHEIIGLLETLIADPAKPAFHRYRDRLSYHVVHITNSEPDADGAQRIHPMLNDAASPLLTVAGTYASQTQMSNSRLKRYLELLNGDLTTIDLYRTTQKGEVFSMNWVISAATRRRMDFLSGIHPDLRVFAARINERAR